MGGMNHQPCGSYLPKSTELSKQVSLITIAMHQANVHLEEVILAELDGYSGKVQSIISSLVSVESGLSEALHINEELRFMMAANGYRDLAPLETIAWDSDLALRMRDEGLVAVGSWRRMVDIMRRKTFYGNLDYFDQGFKKTRDLTIALRECFENLPRECARKIHLVAEENQEGNFKKPFAQLFTRWLKFQQDFLASSLVSTEVWYASTHVGSVLESNQPALVL